MKQNDKKLVEQCESIKNHIEESLNWVEKYLEGSQSKKEGLAKSIKINRRNFKKYTKAAGRKPCLAIFGPSQAGKSYLVSNLAMEPNSDIRGIKVRNAGYEYKSYVSAGDTIDFIKHINPEGGRESTGLVTRFTIDDNTKDGEAPFFIRLLSIVDIVKIISNGYFSDLTDRIDEIDPNEIQEMLINLRKKCTASPTGGVDEDDIYELKEYLSEQFRSEVLIRDLNSFNIWEDMAKLVPYLKNQDRWEIFELLWGKAPFFTDVFKKLSLALESIGFAREARCGLDALIPKMTPQGLSNTIIDVQIINYLYQDNEPLSEVMVYSANGAKASIKRSVLTAIISEITMVLPERIAENKNRAFFKDADVLDFPGARSRLQINVNNRDPEKLIQVFLRGKIAFLFDQYNADNEISSLFLCLPFSNLEVKSIPGLIKNWIYRTHGATKEERSKQLASLFIVFTKFDFELSKASSNHDSKWSARLIDNFKKEMDNATSGESWVDEWDNRGTFKNFFWMRDPIFSRTVFKGVNIQGEGQETDVRDEYKEELEEMKSSFINHEDVRRYFENPQKSWDEAASPGKTGIDYIVEKLTPTCDLKVKREKLKAQIEKYTEEFLKKLESYHVGGDYDQELRKASNDSKQVAQYLVNQIKIKNYFGKFLNALQINDDFAWKVYWDVENPMFNSEENIEQEVEKTLQESILISKEDISSIVGDLEAELGFDFEPAEAKSINESEVKELKYKHKSQIFAEKLIEKWKTKIEEMLTSEKVVEKIGLPIEILNSIFKEISYAATRVELEKTISEAVKEEVDLYVKTRNIDIIARLASMYINEFINTIGFKYVSPEKRPISKKTGKPIFTEYNLITPEKDKLELEIGYPGSKIFIQWVLGITETFVKNVEHKYNCTDINSESNKKIGDIIENVNKLLGEIKG